MGENDDQCAESNSEKFAAKTSIASNDKEIVRPISLDNNCSGK